MLRQPTVRFQANTKTSNVAARVAEIESGTVDTVSSIVAKFEALSVKAQQKPLIQVLPDKRPKSNIITQQHLERTSQSPPKPDKLIEIGKKVDLMSYIQQPDTQRRTSPRISQRSSTSVVQPSEIKNVPSWESFLRKTSIQLKQGHRTTRTDTTTNNSPVNESLIPGRAAQDQKKRTSMIDRSNSRPPAPIRESITRIEGHGKTSPNRRLLTPDTQDNYSPTSQPDKFESMASERLDSLAGPKQQPVLERHTVYAQEKSQEKKSSITSLKAIQKPLEIAQNQKGSKVIIPKVLNLITMAPLHATTTAVSIESSIIEQIRQSASRTHETQNMNQNRIRQPTKSIDVLESLSTKPSADGSNLSKRRGTTSQRLSLKSMISKMGFNNKHSNTVDQKEGPSITSRVKLALARPQTCDTEHRPTLQPEPIKHDDFNDLTLYDRILPSRTHENDRDIAVTQNNKIVRFSDPFLSGDGTSSICHDLINSAKHQKKHRVTPFKVPNLKIQHYKSFVDAEQEPISPKFHSTVTARSIQLLIDSF